MNVVIGDRYRHVMKRGSIYEVVGRAKMQVSSSTLNRAIGHITYVPIAAAEDLEKMTLIVYRSTEDDSLWVRPETEFCDGRFVHVRKVTRYYIAMRIGEITSYYRSGEGHGWTKSRGDATLYGEEDFASRDHASLARDVRSVSRVLSMERYEDD